MRRFIGISRVKTLGFIIAVSVAVACMGLYSAGPRLLEVLENKSLDLRFILRGERDPGDRVVIVAIDEMSVEELGRFPWPRARMAELLSKLRDAGARVVAVDVIFSEPEEGLTPEQADFLSGTAGGDEGLKRFISSSVSGDRALGEALAVFGKTVLPVVPDVPVEGEKRRETGEAPGYVEASSFRVLKGDEDAYNYISADALSPPILTLGEAASSLGHIYAYLDRDGAMRWDALLVKYGDGYYPSLGLAAAREYLGVPLEEMALEFGQGVLLRDKMVPTDEHGRMLINYCGPEGTFRYYPFVDVIEGRVPPGSFKDKIVLVGATAQGIYDLRVTPFSANMPGVEKHANVIENILGGNFMVRRESDKPLDLLIILSLGVMLGVVLPRLGAVSGSAVSLCFLALGWALCYFALVRHGVWIDMVMPTLSIVFIYLAVTSYRFLAEEKKARSIKRVFASYVTPKIVDELAKNPDLARLGGERKEITVLFSDVRGFTSFSESRQPEEVVARLNEYMGEMTRIIFDSDGTVDKFVGDAIMAFWGAPLPQEDQAERAVVCAVRMVRRLREMQDKWAAQGEHVLDMGIGINTGEMVVGNMGAEGRKMDYTVIGDSVNLGARVEGLTKNYDTHIIITEFTYGKVMGRVDGGRASLDGVGFTELDSVKVKGRERPVTIYRVDA